MTAGPSWESDTAPQELMEIIDAAGCLRLLSAVDVGRLALVVDGRPRIVVLNFHLDGERVLFRTREDASIARLTAEGAAIDVEFEVDSAFPVAESGWSVIATGTLTRESDEARIAAARTGVRAWAQGVRDVVLRMDIAQLTGRRVGSL